MWAKSLAKQAEKKPWGQELRRQVDEAWDEAEALSDRAGSAYIDRHGQRKLPEQDSTFMVSVALAAYADRKNMDYVRAR